jgi:hypothetical protein
VQITAKTLANSSLPAADRGALLAFQKKVASLQRAVLGAARVVDDVTGRVPLIRKALEETQAADAGLRGAVDSLETGLQAMHRTLSGDRTLGSRNQASPASLPPAQTCFAIQQR